MDIKLIVTDLDNTLLRTDKTISDRTIEALNQCRKRGIKTAFATARAERLTKKYQERISPDFVIANNGANIYDTLNNIHNAFIPRNARNKLIAALLTYGEISQISVEAETCCYSNCNDFDSIPAVWRALNIVYSDFKTEIKTDTPKISVECANPVFLSNLIKGYPELCLCSNSGENWHQITYTGSTKINAVRHIANLLGFSLDKVAAFGDDNNDIEMLRHCGAGVAVANANSAAKAAAAFTTDSNDNDGVAKWIEREILKLHIKKLQ